MVGSDGGFWRGWRWLLIAFSLPFCLALSSSSAGASLVIERRLLAYDAFLPGQLLPYDIAFIPGGRHRIDRCMLPFLTREFAKYKLPHRHLARVRFRTAFPIGDGGVAGGGDAGSSSDWLVNLTGASGAGAVTQGSLVTMMLRGSWLSHPSRHFDLLFFHELVHTAQYRKGLDLGAYAAASMSSIVGGRRPSQNRFELEAESVARSLTKAWRLSPERRRCYAKRMRTGGPVLEVVDPRLHSMSRVTREAPGLFVDEKTVSGG